MAETCGQCGAPFGSTAELAQHLKTAHPERAAGADTSPERLARGASPCLLCGAVFDSEPELVEHQRGSHAPI